MPFAHLTRSLLRSLLRIEPGEGLRAGLMLLYSIAAVGGVVITGQLAGRVLFISALPSSAIPYKYMLPPLVLMLTTALYTRIAPRFRRDRLVLGCSALMLAGVLVFRLLLETGWHQEFVLLCALFAFFNVVVMIVVLQMWTLAGDLFNPREARRLFGLIAAGSTLSNVLFGALLSWFAKQIDPADLLFVMAAGLICCALCAGVLGYCCREALETTAAEPENAHQSTTAENSILGAFRAMLQSPLLVSLAGIVILVDLVSKIADYQLDLALQAHYGGDSQGMVEFLGLFRFWGGACACALQFFLAARLLERFGVAVLLLLLPASIALGTGAILLSGGILWAAVMPRACDIVLKYTVNDTLINLLYLPVGARLRSRAKALLDGMIKPPVIGLLGLFSCLQARAVVPPCCTGPCLCWSWWGSGPRAGPAGFAAVRCGTGRERAAAPLRPGSGSSAFDGRKLGSGADRNPEKPGCYAGRARFRSIAAFIRHRLEAPSGHAAGSRRSGGARPGAGIPGRAWGCSLRRAGTRKAAGSRRKGARGGTQGAVRSGGTRSCAGGRAVFARFEPIHPGGGHPRPGQICGPGRIAARR